MTDQQREARAASANADWLEAGTTTERCESCGADDRAIIHVGDYGHYCPDCGREMLIAIEIEKDIKAAVKLVLAELTEKWLERGAPPEILWDELAESPGRAASEVRDECLAGKIPSGKSPN